MYVKATPGLSDPSTAESCIVWSGISGERGAHCTFTRSTVDTVKCANPSTSFDEYLMCKPQRVQDTEHCHPSRMLPCPSSKDKSFF